MIFAKVRIRIVSWCRVDFILPYVVDTFNRRGYLLHMEEQYGLSRNENLALLDQLKELARVTENARKMVCECPLPQQSDILRLVSAQGCLLQQQALQFMKEAGVMVGQRQLTRVSMALELFAEARHDFALALKYLPKDSAQKKSISGLILDSNSN